MKNQTGAVTGTGCLKDLGINEKTPLILIIKE
jgi:hypothetical protein